MKKLTPFGVILGLAVSFGMVGCGQSQVPSDGGEGTGSPSASDEHDHDHGDDDHAHPSEGPHHGSLIELGNEEYHAELVHDEDAGKITIYLLDGAVKEAVSISASEITVNVKHEDQGEQFKLTAQPDENDAEGKSSRFVSEDKELGEHLHEEHAEATLVLAINGKSYRGKIAHDHDHGHDHGHDHDH